mmetsp:Transcript_28015/g.57578  ORF Transcript_28015/g.57578 Transcript_28015/m.57578 type:complete len:278 (-) Transcript_28015:347-1180(-)
MPTHPPQKLLLPLLQKLLGLCSHRKRLLKNLFRELVIFRFFRDPRPCHPKQRHFLPHLELAHEFKNIVRTRCFVRVINANANKSSIVLIGRHYEGSAHEGSGASFIYEELPLRIGRVGLSDVVNVEDPVAEWVVVDIVAVGGGGVVAQLGGETVSKALGFVFGQTIDGGVAAFVGGAGIVRSCVCVVFLGHRFLGLALHPFHGLFGSFDELLELLRLFFDLGLFSGRHSEGAFGERFDGATAFQRGGVFFGEFPIVLGFVVFGGVVGGGELVAPTGG